MKVSIDKVENQYMIYINNTGQILYFNNVKDIKEYIINKRLEEEPNEIQIYINKTINDNDYNEIVKEIKTIFDENNTEKIILKNILKTIINNKDIQNLRQLYKEINQKNDLIKFTNNYNNLVSNMIVEHLVYKGESQNEILNANN